MSLDRWIALGVLLIGMAYGYTAFFTMDAALPPFMRNNPIWPSTFPRILSVMAIIISLIILLGIEKGSGGPREGEIDYRRLGQYKIGQALGLLAMMVAYALLLRPAGFLPSTVLFLLVGAIVLGERNYKILVPVSLFAAVFVWYLVQVVLGIFLRPWPFFLG